MNNMLPTLLCVGGPLDRQRFLSDIGTKTSVVYMKPPKWSNRISEHGLERLAQKTTTIKSHIYHVATIDGVRVLRHDSVKPHEVVQKLLARYEKKPRALRKTYKEHLTTLPDSGRFGHE